MNRYIYVFDNPLQYVDPSGRDGLTFMDAVGVAGNTLAGTVDDAGYLVAYPMLKMGSGILNNDAGEFAAGVGLIAVDAVGGVALNEAAYAFRIGWTSRANLLAHFEKHGAEFGFKLAEQYAMAAKRFISTTAREGVESIVTHTGDRMIYNQATKEFALVNKEGEIVTYFKASAKYWQKRLKNAARALAAAAEN